MTLYPYNFKSYTRLAIVNTRAREQEREREQVRERENPQRSTFIVFSSREVERFEDKGQGEKSKSKPPGDAWTGSPVP